jgi:hypothetical protein
VEHQPTAPRLTDTDPDVDRRQIELLRQASPARRIRLALSLSQSVIGLARRGLLRSLDRGSEEEASLRFVEVHYGSDLARRVRGYLAGRRP